MLVHFVSTSCLSTDELHCNSVFCFPACALLFFSRESQRQGSQTAWFHDVLHLKISI